LNVGASVLFPIGVAVGKSVEAVTSVVSTAGTGFVAPDGFVTEGSFPGVGGGGPAFGLSFPDGCTLSIAVSLGDCGIIIVGATVAVDSLFSAEDGAFVSLEEKSLQAGASTH